MPAVKKAFVQALMFLLAACGDKSSIAGHPKLSETQIGVRLNGKIVAETMWQFEENESKEIKIVQADYSGDKAAIVIDIKTTSQGIMKKTMAGRLRLNCEWIANEWNLLTIDNISFKQV